MKLRLIALALLLVVIPAWLFGQRAQLPTKGRRAEKGKRAKRTALRKLPRAKPLGQTPNYVMPLDEFLERERIKPHEERVFAVDRLRPLMRTSAQNIAALTRIDELAFQTIGRAQP